MKLEGITEEIGKRMDVLQLRHAIVFPDPRPVALNRPPAQGVALARDLGEGDPAAVSMVRALVDPADLSDPRFWPTPLGRLLFAVGGYQGEAVPQALAAAVLDVSRQRVHQLVLSGQLRSETGINLAVRQVHAGDVRDLLRAKLDIPVK
jgi:hypothetical protein